MDKATLLREFIISLYVTYTPQNVLLRRQYNYVGVNINKERLVRSLSVAPVTTSKRTCIINTKGKPSSIRDEDQKALKQQHVSIS